MTRITHLIPATLAAAAMAAAVIPAAAQPAGPDAGGKTSGRNCFYSNQWNGWRSPSPTVIYLKVGVRDVYRVDLAAPSNQLAWPSNHLISEIRGSNLICSALDLDLKISDNNGFATPLFPKTLTKLTATETAAIPKKYQP